MSARLYLHPRLVDRNSQLTPAGGALFAHMEAQGVRLGDDLALVCRPTARRGLLVHELARVLKREEGRVFLELMDGTTESRWAPTGPQVA